jgi:hypothetical protein
MIFQSPFKNSHNAVLFVNGIIHFMMFVLFLSMYVQDSQQNYLYVFVAFLLSSISLIFFSIIKLGFIDYQNI